jgi:glycosyltransferase involved in cell wall biosynthesis
MMAWTLPTADGVCFSDISKGDAKRAKRTWRCSRVSALPISRGFLKANAETDGDIGGGDRSPSARPDWTLLAVSYIMSGAVVWAIRAFLGEPELCASPGLLLLLKVLPKLYDGTERVVAWLVDELVDLGHEVTLFATGGSLTKGRLHKIWPRALRLGRRGADPNAACSLLLEAIAKRAAEFDVIRSHIDWLPLPLLSQWTVTFLTTVHGRLDLPGLPDVVREFSEAGFVAISDNQRRQLPKAKWIATIHHGLPSHLFRASYNQGSYLAFLGRLTAEKGWEDAICIAEAVGMPLRIAAEIPRAETGYFKKQVQPHIDGERVTLVGEVDDAKKQPFLAGAAALLFPIDWPEPFVLVIIEAMACGTPVIAYRSGSVLEVAEGGVTGFIVDGEEDAVRVVRELPRLDRQVIRARFEERFTAVRMAREYDARYRDLVTEAETEARVPERASAK